MILARQLAVRLPELVFFRRARYTERLVIVLFACGWHMNWLLFPGSLTDSLTVAAL